MELAGAHTYAAHPEVAAVYFKMEELPQRLPALLSVLSPDAIKKRFASPLADSGPAAIGAGIGPSLAPQVRLVGGWVAYEHYEAHSENTRRILSENVGSRGIVSSGASFRTPDGSIRADVNIKQPRAQLDALATIMNMDWFHFQTAAEYLSSDPNVPTILTGQHHGSVPANTRFHKNG